MSTLLRRAERALAGRPAGGGLPRSREIAVISVLAVRSWSSPPRSKPRASSSATIGWRDLLLTPSILLLLAVGQTVVIITRNVDLSVGSTSASRRTSPAASSRQPRPPYRRGLPSRACRSAPLLGPRQRRARRLRARSPPW